MAKTTFSSKNLSKPTPKWLSIIRTYYVLIGGGTLLSIYGLFDIPDVTTLIINKWYILVGMVIQLVCKAGGYAVDNTNANGV